jgi:23S rRNA (guanosine2251-2'-O)-methyltransferase
MYVQSQQNKIAVLCFFLFKKEKRKKNNKHQKLTKKIKLHNTKKEKKLKVEGRNAVAEAIASDATVDRLAVARGLTDPAANRIIAAAREKGIKIQFLYRAVLDKESATGNHQGFIALTSEFKYSEVDELLKLAESKGEQPLLIILDGVEDPHNLGSVLRVAECGGAHGVIIGKHRAASVNETVVKVSAGAAEHVKVARVTNVNDTIEYLKQRGVWVIAAEADGDSIYKANLSGAVALVIGGEDTGVKRLTREKCDGAVSIPVFGKINSLNASVACGIVLYEIVRRRLTV